MTPPAALPDLHAWIHLGPELGRGGFGTVYRGTIRETGAPVAVKLSHQSTPEDLSRVERESALFRSLAHPRLARFLGLLQDSRGGGLALVYELLPGQPLDQALAPGPPPLATGLAWAREIAEGLDTLHGAGLLHRDLKSENVFLLPDGHLKLLDFGLARSERPGQTVTATGMIMGTPDTMAPELFRGEKASRASDLYAFACLGFEILSGTPPYQGDLGEVMKAHLRGKPPLLSQRCPGAPPGLDPVLARGLALDPTQRPASAGELVALLEAELGRVPAAPSRPLEPPDPAATLLASGSQAKELAATSTGSPAASVDATAILAPSPPPPAPPPRSPPEAASPPWWQSRGPALGVALLIAMGAFLLPGEGPPEPQPPPSPSPRNVFEDSRWPGDVPSIEALEEEFRTAERATQGSEPGSEAARLDLDPIAWKWNLETRLPLLRETLEQLSRRNFLPEISEGQLSRLGILDDEYQRLLLPRPFLAFFARPPDRDYLVPERIRALPSARFLPDHLSGWNALALARMDKVLDFHEQILATSDPGSPEFAARIARGLDAVEGLPADFGQRRLGWRLRLGWRDTLIPGNDSLRLALLAISRAVREGQTPEDTLRVVAVLVEALEQLGELLAGPVSVIPRQELFDGPTRDPALDLLRATLVRRLAHTQYFRTEAASLLKGTRSRLQRVLDELLLGLRDGGPAHRALTATALVQLLEIQSDRPEAGRPEAGPPPGLRATLRDHPELLLEHRPPGTRREDLELARRSWGSDPEAPPFPRELAEGLVEVRRQE